MIPRRAWLGQSARPAVRRRRVVVAAIATALLALWAASAHAAVTADFTWSPQSPTVGEKVTFTSTATGFDLTESWDFDGDGKADVQGHDVSHSFADAGEHKVTLFVHSQKTGEDAQQAHVVTVSPSPAPPPPPAPPEQPVPDPGPSARLTVATPGPLSPGQMIRFDARGSTPSPGSSIVAYRWDFNGDGVYDANTGAIAQATHLFASSGSHTVGLRVEDSSGTWTSTATTVALQNAAQGCAFDHAFGFLEFTSSCIKNSQGVWSIALDDPHSGSVGASMLGVTLTSHVRGAKLELDTTGSNEHGDNPNHRWVLRSNAPVTFALRNSSIGTIELYTVDLQHHPVFLPPGADAPDQGADGLRIVSFQAQRDCPDASSDPPVVCAKLPGNFPLEGYVSIYANLSTEGEPSATVEANVALRNPLSITGDIRLTADVSGGVQLDHFGLKVENLDVGIGTVSRFQLDYDRQDDDTGDLDVWRGEASARLRVPGAPEVKGQLRFANGGFQSFQVELAHANVPLGPVILNRLGGRFGVNPFSIGGSLGGRIGPFGVGAGVSYTAASSTAPWHFQIRDASITYLNLIRAGGSLDVYGDGYVGGDVGVIAGFPSVDHPDTVLIQGYVRGWAFSGVYQISGGVRLVFHLGPLSGEGQVQGFVNNTVAAGCGSVTVGVTVAAWARIRLDDGHVDAGMGGCDNITPYCQAPPPGHEAPSCLGFASAAASAGNGAQRIEVRDGLPAENLVLRSATGTPSATISGPSGTYVAPSEARLPYISGTIAEQHELLISILHPKPGVYTITPTPGSPPVSRVLAAQALPAPPIHVRVLGKGRARRLAYRMRLDPGEHERVEFVERGRDVGHVIGTATRSRGSIRFTPQPGDARARTIVAQLYTGGVPQKPRTVGRYSAPPPPRPGRPAFVRIRRAANSAVVTWGPAPNASRWQVQVSAGDGRRVLYAVPAGRRRLVVERLFPQFAARVAVSAVGGPRRQLGHARRASLRAAPRAKRVLGKRHT